MFPIYLIFTLCVCVSSQWLNDYANVNGVKLWSATVNAPATTVTHLGNIPTLVYNCAIVPSLCQTAEHAGRLGAATGNYPHGQEAFGWDPNSNRKSSRRKNACPDNWKKKSKLDPDGHACPEDNQPPVHPIGYTNVVPPLVDQPSYAILRLNPQTQVPEKTGLMYTCDEFPPAMSVQGGNGTDQAPNVGRDTYCATQSHDCSSTLWETAIPTIHGEQDWQRSAHQFLSSHVGTDRLHIWEYYFKTVRINSNVATWVEWVPPGASRYEYEDWYGSKRDIMSPRKGKRSFTSLRDLMQAMTKELEMMMFRSVLCPILMLFYPSLYIYFMRLATDPCILIEYCNTAVIPFRFCALSRPRISKAPGIR